jgi:hypothetical protein
MEKPPPVAKRIPRFPAPAVRLAILLVAALILVMAVVMMKRSGALSGLASGGPGPGEVTTNPIPRGAAPSVTPEGAAPGTVALDDFIVVVPENWQRKKEMENEGPGTKLFLVGPVLAGVNLVMGIDVFGLPESTSLPDSVKEYSKPWQGKPSLAISASTLCGEPAEMVSFEENGQQKMFLMMARRGKFFVIGMISPAGQKLLAVKEFEQVLSTFQVYD